MSATCCRSSSTALLQMLEPIANQKDKPCTAANMLAVWQALPLTCFMQRSPLLGYGPPCPHLQQTPWQLRLLCAVQQPCCPFVVHELQRREHRRRIASSLHAAWIAVATPTAKTTHTTKIVSLHSNSQYKYLSTV
jgi:hypothetical protein